MIVTGPVIKRDQIGRTLGFPTANVQASKQLTTGVYAGSTLIDGKKCTAALYVSQKNPTILETHIIDEQIDLYGKELSVTIGKKIRDDQEFESKEALIKQIRKDIEDIRNA